ncbi:MAG: hypothetical protein KF850_34180 [Labilithrix sp.]|nr:hypothetical protein [Labilithrix sp.]
MIDLRTAKLERTRIMDTANRIRNGKGLGPLREHVIDIDVMLNGFATKDWLIDLVAASDHEARWECIRSFLHRDRSHLVLRNVDPGDSIIPLALNWMLVGRRCIATPDTPHFFSEGGPGFFVPEWVTHVFRATRPADRAAVIECLLTNHEARQAFDAAVALKSGPPTKLLRMLVRNWLSRGSQSHTRATLLDGGLQ